jgi:uncharacterized protein (DUF2147 family)
MNRWFLPFLILISQAVLSQTLTGKWKTIDDGTGESKSIVEIFERSGKLFGKVIKTYPKPGEDPDPVCDQCPEDDARFGQKIIGMEILKDFIKDGAEYSGGNILDPENGKVYKCRIWLEGADLKVRGFWGIFWRTQTWKKVD